MARDKEPAQQPSTDPIRISELPDGAAAREGDRVPAVRGGVTIGAHLGSAAGRNVGQAANNVLALDNTGQIPEALIPASIMRDAEFTATAVRGLLNLTPEEVNDLFTGATISGRTITITQNDGQTLTLTLPEGGGMPDGVLSSGTFSNDGQTLTLTLDDGTQVSIPVPDLLTSHTEQRVVHDQAASADTQGKINFHEGAAEITEPVIHEGTPQTATFEAPDDPHFEGAESVRSGGRVEDRFGEDDWVFSPAAHRPYVVVDRDPLLAGVQKVWRQTRFSELLPNFTDYIGEFPDDESAGPHVTNIRSAGTTGSLYFDTTLEELKEATSITAGADRTIEYLFRRLLTSIDFIGIDARLKINAENIEAHTTRLVNLTSSLIGEGTTRVAGDRITATTIGTAAAYQAALTGQLGSDNGLVLHITSNVNGSRDSTAYAWLAGQILYLAPLSDVPIRWFLIGQGGGGGGGLSAEQAARIAGVTVHDETAARTASDAALGVRIDNLDRDFSIEPDYFLREVISAEDIRGNAKPRTYVLHVHPDSFPAGATHLQLTIGGANAGARAELASDETGYSFTFDTLGIGNILRNSHTTARIDIVYYDAANAGHELGRIINILRVVETVPNEAADNSLTPAKMDADTDAKKKAFREAFASAHIGSGLALPRAEVSNVGDVWIFPRAVANGLAWRDISDSATIINSAESGDVALYLNAVIGWVRVGNILNGRGNREHIVRAYARIQSTSGVITVQFPADYATYKYYELIVKSTNNAVVVVDGPTAMLAMQQDGDNIRFPVEDTAEDGNQQWLTWTPSTRTFGRQAQGSLVTTYQSARLYD